MIYRTTAWMSEAACRDFPHFAELYPAEQVRTCQGCTVTVQCAELGLASVATVKDALNSAVYGGLHPRQLAELVRQRGHYKGMDPAAAVVDPPAAAGRTRGGGQQWD